MPGTRAELLDDVRIPIAITEGAKRTIALHRLSEYGLNPDDPPRFLAVGLGGVWSFRGTIGKVAGPDGSRRDEKGLINDLRRLAWAGRRVYIVFDSNVHTNSKVAAARRQLSTALSQLGAHVYWVDLPKPDEVAAVNGIDDLLAAWGPERVLALFGESEPAETHESETTQAEKLIRLCDEVELFHTPQGEAYAVVPVGEHREIWMLQSRGFWRWLARQFHKSAGKPPRAQSLKEAIGLLEAKAQFESAEHPVWVRVAEHDSRIYIDLCNAAWEAVEISENGWRITVDPPVRFRRTKGMQPLPRPVSGCVTALRRLINIGDDDNWILCLSWLLAALRSKGPFPILLLQGEQGSAKSSTERFLRRIVDPVVALVRTPPRSDRDLLIAAVNSWVIAYDNLSGIPHWLSDAFCRLSTGGGFSTRELYTDSDEVIFDATRPIILNGIDHLAERADLADRSLILHLPRIEGRDRRDEQQLNREFELELPGILGALYTAVSVALATVNQVRLDSLPRMADFALWAVAGMRGFELPAEAFLTAYRGNRREAVQDTLEADVVAAAIFELMDDRLAKESTYIWDGTCKQLLRDLECFADEATKKSPGWPKTPRGLSSRLRRVATFLLESSIEIIFHPKSGRGQRLLSVRRIVQTTAATAATASESEHGTTDESVGAENVSGGQP
jgi:hypothetical protein